MSFAGTDLVLAFVKSQPEQGDGKSLVVWVRRLGVRLAVFKPARPDQHVGEEMAGAPNGRFCVVRVRQDASAPTADTNVLQVWRLPRPGQVHVSAGK